MDGLCGTRDNDLDASVCVRVPSLASHGHIDRYNTTTRFGGNRRAWMGDGDGAPVRCQMPGPNFHVSGPNRARDRLILPHHP